MQYYHTRVLLLRSPALPGTVHCSSAYDTHSSQRSLLVHNKLPYYSTTQRFGKLRRCFREPYVSHVLYFTKYGSMPSHFCTDFIHETAWRGQQLTTFSKGTQIYYSWGGSTRSHIAVFSHSSTSHSRPPHLKRTLILGWPVGYGSPVP